jgi:galactose mutarotase-like enzyme
MSIGVTRHHGCRISDDWTLAGLRTVILENELLRVVVLIDKGSDMIEFRYKPRDLDFLLRLPGGVRHPQRELPSSAGAPFLDYYSGGWNEILPNGGPPVNYRGADLGQHGEVSLLPWEHALVEDTPERVAVRLWVRPLRTPFYLEKTLSLQPGRAVLAIEETLTNEGGEALHCMWGQHIAFGRPFLEEGAIVDAPARRFIVHEAMPGYEPRRFHPGSATVWPQAIAPDGTPIDASCVPAFGAAQAQEMAYLAELTDGWYAITNPVQRVGFGLRFDHTLYRYIWYWQQLGNVAQGYPWWGRLHTMALEPWTSYPTNGLTEAIANGTALLLQPGESRHTTLHAVAYEGIDRVGMITPDGQVR